jgi:mono/diheme cytochrome c family protein
MLVALLVVLPVLGHAAPSAKKICARSCRTLQTNCLGFAKAERDAAQAACVTDPNGAKVCRRAARQGFKSDAAACRAARAGCKPCCKLGGVNECARGAAVAIPASPQATGDPVSGRDTLLNGDYMTCGVPFKVWSAVPGFVAGGYGGTADAPRIPDRTGRNAELPFFLNAFVAPGNGAEVVNGNCLMCHGGVFDGQLVIGLGNATADFTAGAGGGAGAIPITDDLLDLLGLDDAERAQLLAIAARAAVLGPQTMMRTIGQNPAEILAVILMVHHDRETLAWSDTPVTPLTLQDKLTSDPPPWWRVHKKTALFYNGMARGDHRGTMALATSVCVDDVARATAVDAQFLDIQAFVASVRAPAYTRTIDQALASQGEPLFLRDCAGCHGTYAAREEDETYSSLILPLDVIGTDPVVAEAGVVYAPELVDWYNLSFYGEITRMVPDEPFPGGGYMAPPLDGIWATAPFLHNGSVPTVELVLNSRARPTYWRRVDLDSTNFDETALGWPYVTLDGPAETVPEAERKLVYDTTFWSQSKAGHTFGDHLTAEERRAVIEYLKTL